MKLWDKNIIAVYGTLKREHNPWNHSCMIRAEWKFIKEAYVEFNKLEWRWFPTGKFTSWTNKWVLVELFEVNKEWVENSLDRLEWYPTFYNRKKVPTLDWDEVIIYEIVREIEGNWDPFFTHEEWGKKFYNWN